MAENINILVSRTQRCTGTHVTNTGSQAGQRCIMILIKIVSNLNFLACTFHGLCALAFF